MFANILITIKNLDTDESSVEDMMLAKSQLATVDAGYQELGLPTPEWVIDKLSAVTSGITAKVRAELTRRLRAAKARREGLRTSEEKRKGLESEIEMLEDKLK